MYFIRNYLNTTKIVMVRVRQTMETAQPMYDTTSSAVLSTCDTLCIKHIKC